MTPNGIRVLVVEDDALVAMLAQECLEEAGYTVVAVASGLQDALALATSLELDAAVLDLNLRGEMSFPVVQVLRRRHVPFLICSGYDTTKMSALPQDIPALSKPVSPQRLTAALAETIRAFRAEQVMLPIGDW
jgi:DNA-binding response OmpR family regulator